MISLFVSEPPFPARGKDGKFTWRDVGEMLSAPVNAYTKE